MSTPLRQRPITAITKRGGLIIPARLKVPPVPPVVVTVDWIANLDNTVDQDVILFGEQCTWLGSFGPSFFNIRFLGEIQPNGYTSLTVTIPGIGTESFPWNETQGRYQGNWIDIQPNLLPLRGTSSEVTVTP